MPWIRKHVTEWIRGLLIILFMYTAVSKLLDPAVFMNDLLKATYLDVSLLPALAWLIPGAEMLTVLLLILRPVRHYGFVISFFLLVLFTCHLLLLKILNPLSPCSCGGLISALSPSAHLYLNGCFILLAAWPLMIVRKE